MKELFLATENGIVPLDENQIEKYNLSEGMTSPFSRYKIVDKNGAFVSNRSNDKDKTDTDVSQMPEGEGLADDEIIEFPEGEIYSTSEIIEISQGTDSSVEGNR